MRFRLHHTVVCSVRNEGPYLVEWVAWQRMLGFDDIVIVTNDCTDSSPALLDAFQASGWITHLRRDVPEGHAICAKKLAAARQLPQVTAADWVMVCDVDEFLVVRLGQGGIADLTASVSEPFLGMAINWRVFGTSGIEAFRDAPVHRQFLRAARAGHPTERWIKSIHAHADWFFNLGEHGPKRLDPAHATGAGVRWVNTAGQTLTGWSPDGPYLRMVERDEVSCTAAQINHYMLRSLDSFAQKFGTPSAVAGKDRYTWDYFTRFDRNDIEDRSALSCAARFDPIHAQAMALPGVARLHHLCCAEYVARLCAKAGVAADTDPRHAHHMARARD